MNRSTLLRSFASSAAALAVPGTALAADDNVNVGIMALDSAMESNYAAKIGFASAANLNLSIEAMSNGAAVMAAVAGRAVNVGAVNIFSVLQGARSRFAHRDGCERCALFVEISDGRAARAERFAAQNRRRPQRQNDGRRRVEKHGASHRDGLGR